MGPVGVFSELRYDKGLEHSPYIVNTNIFMVATAVISQGYFILNSSPVHLKCLQIDI